MVLMINGAGFSSAGLQMSEEKIDKHKNSDSANYVLYSKKENTI
jgi:hypothetical protein